MNRVIVYTDGACSGNPGPGGIGIVINYPDKTLEISEGYHLTTNNRMELLAAIVAIEVIGKGGKISLYTDSKYLSDAINQDWIRRWHKNGWKTSNKKKIKNIDLWERLITLLRESDVDFHWIEGHQGHHGNERANHLSQQALKNPAEKDQNYEDERDSLGMFNE